MLSVAVLPTSLMLYMEPNIPNAQMAAMIVRKIIISCVEILKLESLIEIEGEKGETTKGSIAHAVGKKRACLGCVKICGSFEKFTFCGIKFSLW
jgi:hypothetical protein